MISLAVLSAISLHDTIDVEIEVANGSDTVIEDLQITTRRGDTPGDGYPFYGTRAFPDDLQPGERATVHMSVPTNLGPEGTLAITEPGAYPLMFALTGTQEGDPAALADDTILLNIGEPDTTHTVNVIFPITAPLDIVPGETGGEPLILKSESLAEELAPGGRLDELLDAYLAHGIGCVALDPGLVHTVERMTEGYTVGERPSVVKKRQRLRDSWFQEKPEERAGTGAEDAQAWLDKLQSVDCTIALPWGNADLDAVARTHNERLLREAIAGAQFIVSPSGRMSQDIGIPVIVADDQPWSGQAVAYDAALTQRLRDDDRPFSAAAAVRLATTKDTVVVLPPDMDPDGARAVLEEAERYRESPLQPQPGTGYSAAGDPEIATVEQQAHYVDELTKILVEDPAIALTPEGFTRPLMQDLLIALSEHDDQRLRANAATLRELRAAVTLLPPGNVYTRTSASSPLLIVAENGLPLPVDAQILYEATDATLHTPSSLRIPAKGSITATMTADQQGRSDIRLWLATPEGATISQPVVIAVQTRDGMLSVYGLGVAVAALGAFALRRKK